MKGVGERGLTLVELLVVLVILGLASSLVLLNAPPSRAVVERDALRLAASVRIALDEMVTTGAAYRLVLDPAGYGFERFSGGEWTADGIDRAFQRTEFDRGVVASIEFNDAAFANARALGGEAPPEAEDDEPKVIRLDPIGASATFTVRLSSSKGAYRVELGSDGDLSVKPDV
ncbi:MAG: prepilin-type N-terminal cleavage/methylation domain-containing protein [Parvularculaceae bacterium]